MSNSSYTSNHAIAVPKAGGAVRGLGEKFSPDLHTGTGNYTVPLTVPPGRRGLQPDVTLRYSTGHGNGFFGAGWQLSIPSIPAKLHGAFQNTRETATGSSFPG